MKLVISAGGTGGHIFPGIAVAESLTAQNAGNSAVFIGTPYGLEKSIIPGAGFKLHLIEAHQFLGRSMVHKAVTILRIIKGILMCLKVLKMERPDAILGMGGFTSVPVILAGKMLGMPCFIHEQNVEPGLANKLLSRITRTVFVSFDETAEKMAPGRTVHSGNPLRQKLKRIEGIKDQASFGIFVFGGSRGARSINDAVISLLPHLEEYKNVAIYHQTGPDDLNRVQEAYAKTSVAHEVFAFTNEMERYYALSDVVISRAGATTIFELAFFRKAAILIPYPYSAGNHQWQNAAYVERQGGCHLVNNDEATGERLFGLIRQLMKNRELIRQMGKNLGRIFVDDAALRIIGGIEHGLS
ncbi:MAG TPA: undecaprenyldiphospho-muramoylpentapeptide beta-N-acetylglucosaminyltransferase [Syntrophorhabdaceae bacterium]|nr:undecaprenyldiphospho-muramoylpentapeptide beta-N-acetylglucosaminyltransferase [Syntrophorhabdaceae bacterium]